MQGIAQTCVRVRPAPYLYEHMFSSLKHITDKAADALDLAIELVTLGEYGLEYPEPVRSGKCKTIAPVVTMHRSGVGRQEHRNSPSSCHPGRSRVELPGWGEHPGHEIPGALPDRRHKATGHTNAHLATGHRHRHRPTAALPGVLRPPRIRLETL